MFHIALICSLSFAKKPLLTLRKIKIKAGLNLQLLIRNININIKKNVQQTQQEREIAHYPVIRSDLTDDHVSTVSPQSQLQT